MINVQKIPLEKTHAFSSLLKDYLVQKESLYPFQDYAPSMEGIVKATEELNFSSAQRTLLQAVLKIQYQGLTISSTIQNQLDSIAKENTYFITTGQQIHVLGGPLYVLFKIATTIKLAEECNRKMPDKHFIPLFWMASEDHDLEEINHLSVFGKQFQVDLNAKGPSGKVSTEAINAWIDSVPDVPEIFKQAYKKCGDLAAATRYWIHDLFAENGLLVLDADDVAFKKSFIPVIEQELFAGLSVNEVRENTTALEQLGYKGQIHARDINLFYLSEQGRNRISFEKDTYEILDTNISFNQYQLKEEVHAHPERFSPNVVLRPIYQQYILPNVAYVGGPAEIAYWMQLTTLFHKLQWRMPVLMPRNFGMVVNKNIRTKFEKLDIAYEEIFLSEDELKALFFSKREFELPNWDSTTKLLHTLWEDVEIKALQADGSLKGFVSAEKSKIEKQLDGIQKRVHKAYEQKLEQELKQLTQLQEKVLPSGTLQERKESFLTFMINDSDFVQHVVKLVNPLDFSFHIFTYDE